MKRRAGGRRPVERGSSTRLREGDRFEGEVRDLTSAGLGVVVHPDGRVFFVAGVWPGERGEFVVAALRGRSGEATLRRLDLAAPGRVEPPCGFHGTGKEHCGGCPWQFMRYEEQLAAKQLRVERLLEGHAAPGVIEGIWPSPDEYGYRNRAQLKTDGRQLGFVAASTHRLAPVSDCLVLNAHNRATLRALRERLPRRDWQPRRGRDWTTLHIDDGIDAAGVVPDRRRPFRQGNSAQNARMRAWIRATLAGLGEVSPVLELFAGSGNFTAVLVEAGSAEIHAADGFAPAVDALQARGWPGVTASCVDLHRAGAAQLLAAPLARARLLLLDPPREGMGGLGEFLDRATCLEHIVYVTCDAATFARDLGVAAGRGFGLRTVQPLDLFPHTPHVELLALLGRSAHGP